MTSSPLHVDYVTRREFNDFKTDVDIRFDVVEHKIDDLKKFTVQGFEKMEQYIDETKMEILNVLSPKVDLIIDMLKEQK